MIRWSKEYTKKEKKFTKCRTVVNKERFVNLRIYEWENKQITNFQSIRKYYHKKSTFINTNNKTYSICKSYCTCIHVLTTHTTSIILVISTYFIIFRIWNLNRKEVQVPQFKKIQNIRNNASLKNLIEIKNSV